MKQQRDRLCIAFVLTTCSFRIPRDFAFYENSLEFTRKRTHSPFNLFSPKNNGIPNFSCLVTAIDCGMTGEERVGEHGKWKSDNSAANERMSEKGRREESNIGSHLHIDTNEYCAKMLCITAWRENEQVVSSLFRLPSALHELSFACSLASSFVLCVYNFRPAKMFTLSSKMYRIRVNQTHNLVVDSCAIRMPQNKHKWAFDIDDKFDAHRILFFP